MRQLAASFVPCADEVWRLQNREGAECDLFRVIAEQGHYAGRTEPTNTRQGIYALAPSGTLLASVNTRRAGEMASMLEYALDQWEQLPEEARYLPTQQVTNRPLQLRLEAAYPKDGLALRTHSRDLPRDPAKYSDERRRRDRNWRRHASNRDYAWFRASEVRQFIPRMLAVGQMTDVPERLIKRLARLHLIDNVRGQTSSFDAKHVQLAELTSRITAIDEDSITIELTGRTRTVFPGVERNGDEEPADNPERSRRRHDPSLNERGVETDLLGTATLNRSANTFSSFELIAIGSRWGGTRYNSRERDLDRNGIGFLFTLAEDDPPVAPAFLWEYGW